MEQKKSTPAGDFVKEAIWGAAIISPVIDTAFKIFDKIPFKQALKESYATVAGWKRNAIWGGVFGLASVGIGGLTGRYKQQPELPQPLPAPVVLPQDFPAPPVNQTGFTEKEMQRREEQPEQAAHIG